MLVFKSDEVWTNYLSGAEYLVDLDGDLRIKVADTTTYLRFNNKGKAESALFLILDNIHKPDFNYFVFDKKELELTVVMK